MRTITLVSRTGKTNFLLLILLVLLSCPKDSSDVTLTNLLSIDYGISENFYITLANADVLLEQKTYLGDEARFFVSPPLPSGLALGTTSGNIRGTPTTSSLPISYTVTASTGGNSYSKTIFLGVAPSRVWVTNIYPANPYQLTAYVVGDGSKQTGVRWSSTDRSKATVDNNGVVDLKTSLLGGNVVITATKDGKSGGMSFTVGKPLSTTLPSINYSVSEDFYIALVNTNLLLEQKTDFGSKARFSVIPALPNGLTLDATNGDISGAPTGIMLPIQYTVTAVVDTNSYTNKISLGISPSRVWVTNTVGNPYDLTAYVVGDGTKQTGVIWSSGDTSLATVNNNGVVDLKSSSIGGNVVIAATKDGDIGRFTFNVFSAYIDYGEKDFYIAQVNTAIDLVQNSKFSSTTFSVTPALPSGLILNTTNGSISGRPTVVMHPSEYTVTAKTGGRSQTKKVILGVSPSEVWVINTNSANPYQLTAYEVGDRTKQTGFSWSSSDRSLATVNNGVVDLKTSLLGGNVVISAIKGSLTYGVSFYVTHTPINYRDDFYIARVNIEFDFVQQSKFSGTTFSITPSLPDGLTLDTSSGDIRVTTLVAMLPRDYTVTATVNGRSETKKITLGVAPSEVWVTNDNPSTKYKLKAYVVGNRAKQAGISWSSSDTSLATVDNNGVVTIQISPLGGDVEIIATTTDGKTGRTVFNVASTPIDYGTRDFYITRVNNQISLVQNTRFDSSTVFSVTPTLPNGLTLNTASGSISGIPTINMLPRDYTVTAMVNGRSETKKITLGVAPSEVWVTSINPSKPYELTVYVVGDRTQQTGFTWSSSDTSLATVSNGVVSFVPTSTGGTVRIYADKSSYGGTVSFTVDKVEDVNDGKIIIKGGVTNLVINSGVTAIARYQFQRKGLSQVTIPDSVTTIGNEAFYNNELTSVVIPKNLTGLGNSAFALNQLTSVEIPNRVSFIGNSAFYNNQLINVVISDGVVTIGEEAFASNPLTNVVIPDSVIDIKRQAFHGNELTSVVIPDSVTSLGSEAFVYNRNLVEVSLKQSLYDSLGSSGREDVFGSQVKKYIRR